MSHRDEFIHRFGPVYEHSAWIAEQVFDQGQAATREIENLHKHFCSVIRSAGTDRQLALLNAHPELACAQGALTDDSKNEQSGAGLDQCTAEEFREFSALNQDYREKFGFPFIMAVKGCNRRDILESFRARLDNSGYEEFQTAVEQVIRIGRFRIEGIFAKYR